MSRPGRQDDSHAEPASRLHRRISGFTRVPLFATCRVDTAGEPNALLPLPAEHPFLAADGPVNKAALQAGFPWRFESIVVRSALHRCGRLRCRFPSNRVRVTSALQTRRLH